MADVTDARVDRNAKQVSGARVVAATPEQVFDLLTDPTRHGEIDGSGMVQHARGNSDRLAMGTRFGMNMKMGPIPYRITNTVVEFDENRSIAWQHFGKHRWRYELESVDGGTLVTETFDYSTAVSSTGIELLGYPARHCANIDATLERLAGVFA